MSINYNKRPKQTPWREWIRLHVQCWFTHANVQHFFNEAIKFAATFRDDVKLFDEAFRHFTIVLEVVMFVN